MSHRKSVTIEDIALHVGVSKMTVSNVLGVNQARRRHVSEQTRAQILEVAHQMRYRPNAVARGLAKKRMNTIGVVVQHEPVSTRTNPVLNAILDGILTVSTLHQQFTTLVTVRHWGEAVDVAPALCDGRCDGILLIVPEANCGLISDLADRGLPFVMIGTHSGDPRITSVDIDNVQAAKMALEHLLEMGHRRIAFFCTILGTHQFVEERIAGYCEALAAQGIAPDPALIILENESGDHLPSLLAWPVSERPTAFFCATDTCALFLLEQLAVRGMRVPQDISVVGFDDISAAVISRPPLTTVRQQSTLAGERGAELLLGLIDKTHERGLREDLPTELIKRCSVAPLINS